MRNIVNASVLATVLASGAAVQAATILMDLGDTAATPTVSENLTGATRYWNNIGHQTADATPFSLITTDNTDSGVTLSISNVTARTPGVGFNDSGPNRDGVTTGLAARGYPASATRDSLFGNTPVFGGFAAPNARLAFSGLDPAQSYDLFFFASRNNVTDNRETAYVVTGATSTTSYLNTANAGGLVSVLGVTPNAGGVVTVDVSAGPNNTNGSKFYYLGVVEIAAVPEPTSLGLLALVAGGLLRRRS